jgi:hypothetical protein
MSRTRRPRRITSVERRQRSKDRQGKAIIAACVLVLSGYLYGAYKIDQAHGISVSQSLHNWGIG